MRAPRADASPAATARPRRWLRLCFAGMLATCVAGVATALTLGRTPAFEKLVELTAGVSTTSQIVALLGEPQGRGKAQLLPTAAPQDVLVYESSEMEGSKASARMLIVFVDRATGVYQGHLWFAGGRLVVRKE